MAQKSSGTRHGTRRKLAAGDRRTGRIADRLRRFTEGQQVRIDIDPSLQDGMPHPRFHGRTATVVETTPGSCVVELVDGGKRKQFAVRPAHLATGES
ncbi:MAG: 50S ribosomal protein L21e [Candidatus Nanohaloarchaea archaeon]|nr:50S ribosomal protein L21e [Candidatus Nanohaloarchaea archaeon]